MFGSFKLKIDVVLDKYNYVPGETINGKVILKIKKDFFLKDLKVFLFAIRDVKSYSSKGQSTRRDKIYSFDYVLERDKSFSKTENEIEIPLTLKIPEGVYSPSKLEKNVIKGVGFLTGNFQNIFWKIKARARIKGCLFNVSKKIKITVQKEQ
jgi:hypothetical protein